MQLRRDLFIYLFIYLFISCSISQNPSTPDKDRISEINFNFSSLKLMDGLFYEHQSKIYLVSGTEIIGYNDGNYVFVYNVSDRKLVLSKKLDNSVSMTAFCETKNSIFFGTISKTKGCKLMEIDKSSYSVEECVHYNSKGIYAIAYDNDQTIFIATSDSIGLYSYNLKTKAAKTINQKFLNEKFIRSMTYCNGYCYLGIGTHADLVKMDVTSGNFGSVLPEAYKSNTWVYDIDAYGENIYFLLSPSYEILTYNVSTETIMDTNYSYISEGIFYNMTEPYYDYISLAGNNFFFDQDEITGQAQLGTAITYINNHIWYGLDSSGIIREKNGSQEFLIDLYNEIPKQTLIPGKLAVNNDIIYAPFRRFQVYDIKGDFYKTFIVEDEPQAIYSDENGLYTANYTLCTVYFYPWQAFNAVSYSINLNDESFLLADIENQCRPADIEKSDDGKYLFIASGPMYGKFGGAISTYDLQKHCLLYTDINIIENHSIADIALSKNKNSIWIGSSAYGENTWPPYDDTPGHLALYDYLQKKILLDIVPPDKSRSIGNIIEKDSYLFCTSRNQILYLYDATSGELLNKKEDLKLQELLLYNNHILGIDSTALYEINNDLSVKRLSFKSFRNLSHLTYDKKTNILYFYDDEKLIQFISEF